ncbi:MAG TPA: hypothetical protein VJH92_03980 [Candidatus Nanoarchaeia archaeon]|nr:hypothetical protein [Candidatus Nanoarchaeia archaeon]
MKTAILWVAVLLLLPSFVFAFDCSTVSDSNYCKSIVQSNLNETQKDSILSFLLYKDNSYPDHQFIENYNRNIPITSAPEKTVIYNSQYIKGAWVSFLAISPSVYDHNLLYIPKGVKVLSEYDYNIQIPPDYAASSYPKNSGGDCKIKYSVQDTDEQLNYYHNGDYVGTGKSDSFIIPSSGTVKAELVVSTKLRVKHYQWEKYKIFKKTFYRCVYDYTDYSTDKITISEQKNVVLYTKLPKAKLTVTNQYEGTTKGNFSAQDYSTFILHFKDSEFTEQQVYYELVFEKKPFHIAYLRAHDASTRTVDNIHVEGNTFYVKNTQDCQLTAYNHFYKFQKDCNLTLNQEEVKSLTIEENEPDFRLLVYLCIFLFLCYVLYKILRSQMKKIILPLLLLLLLPSVLAAPEGCSLSNLGACLTENFFEYLLSIILSGPLVPLLLFIEKLFTASISINLFHNIWNMVIYILSFFYIFFFLYSGYVFLTKSNDPIKRAHAKEMLQNTMLMMVLINGSFYIYKLILDLSSILNASIISMVKPTFFLLTADNYVNIGLQFMLSWVYGITLLFTTIMLTIRYVVVSFGVVLLPIAIFLYFIPPLKGYGQFLLNMLGIFIFVAFIDLLIILGCSMLVEIPLFANFKIIVMITCFLLINYTLWLAIKFALTKSANGSMKDDLKQAAKYIALLV